MKILKLLSKKSILLVVSFLLIFIPKSYSEIEPVDIWSTKDKQEIKKNSIIKSGSNKDQKISVNKSQIQINNSEIEIQEDETLDSKKIKIIGLYDPQDNAFRIDMWSNADGYKIKETIGKIKKINLSADAKEILSLTLLTNSYFPDTNITNEEFLKIKLDWLVRNNDLNLMEEFLLKNQKISESKKLIKHLVNDYLSKSQLEKSCEILSKIEEVINDDYLSKFNIYCLIENNKSEEAQLQLDLKKELGFKDNFFDKKFNYLMGYTTDVDKLISEKSILDFHLSHRTNPNFNFEPSKSTTKNIWKYLSTSNLLDSLEDINIEDENKIRIIEKATHDNNYTEEELYNLYRKYQFSINQLLNIKQSYKLLSNIKARALIYQGILITTEIELKLELMKILKDLFDNENLENAFNDELIKFLKDINKKDVPSNYTNFYNQHINYDSEVFKRIKINNKVIHQSKLLNYFRKNINQKIIKKDLNDILRKIKKDKKYYISTKDKILLESLKSDGIISQKKYKNIYKVEASNMPNDIQDYIKNDNMGMALLRIVEIIGQDKLEDIEPETLYFIISALNQLNIDSLRNKILLKVLPLKV
jgi:hypothetical protein